MSIMMSCAMPIKIKAGIIKRLILAEVFGFIVKFERSSSGISTIKEMISTASVINRFIIRQAPE